MAWDGVKLENNLAFLKLKTKIKYEKNTQSH